MNEARSECEGRGREWLEAAPGGRGLGVTGGGVMARGGEELKGGGAPTGTRLVCNQREIEKKHNHLMASVEPLLASICE